MAEQGFGAIVYHDAGYGLSDATTKLGVATAITTPKIKVDKSDVSSYESPDQAKQYDPSWIEADDISVTLLYDKTDAAAVYALLAVKSTFKITLASGDSWLADGFVSEFGADVPMDDKVSTEVSITISGKPTWTASA